MARQTAPTDDMTAREGEMLAAAVAANLGLTKQAIGLWLKRPGAPVRVVGTRTFVRFHEFARWREQELCRQAVDEATKKLREQLDRAGSPQGDPMQRKLTADARKAEIEVALLERSVITVSEALAVIERLLTSLRALLTPFPRTAAPKLLGAKTLQELEQRLDGEVAKLMATLAQPIDFDAVDQPEHRAA